MSILQEGQAKQSLENSHANDDGVIDKDEQKAIDRAHKKALESRCAPSRAFLLYPATERSLLSQPSRQTAVPLGPYGRLG